MEKFEGNDRSQREVHKKEVNMTEGMTKTITRKGGAIIVDYV